MPRRCPVVSGGADSARPRRSSSRSKRPLAQFGEAVHLDPADRLGDRPLPAVEVGDELLQVGDGGLLDVVERVELAGVVAQQPLQLGVELLDAADQ